MSALAGILEGALGTALLDAMVSSPKSDGTTVAAQDLQGGFGLLGKFIQKVVDPTIPAVANHASTTTKSTTTKSASTTAATTTAASTGTSSNATGSTGPALSIPSLT